MLSAGKEGSRLPERFQFPRSTSSLPVLIVLLLVFSLSAPHTAAVVVSIPHHPCIDHAEATAVIDIHNVIGKSQKDGA